MPDTTAVPTPVIVFGSIVLFAVFLLGKTSNSLLGVLGPWGKHIRERRADKADARADREAQLAEQIEQLQRDQTRMWQQLAEWQRWAGQVQYAAQRAGVDLPAPPWSTD